jgi:hypothetical protein
MRDGSDWYNIGVGVLCFGAFVLLFLMLKAALASPDPTIRLPVLVITGVMALFATLALVAVTFSVAGLSDHTQPLGLPEGSVRAAIALSLIVIFSITSIYFYTSLKDAPANAPNADFAKQVFAVVGTLMASVASYYFASRTVTATARPGTLAPKLASITPSEVSRAAGAISVKIFGTDLQLTKSVSLARSGGITVPGTDVTSSDELIKCEFAMDAALAEGKYDVVVTSSDGGTTTLPGAFQVNP